MSRPFDDAGLHHVGVLAGLGVEAVVGVTRLQEFADDDPSKVVRLALQGAASIAGLLITTEAMIAERPDKSAPPMPGGGMGNMDF